MRPIHAPAISPAAASPPAATAPAPSPPAARQPAASPPAPSPPAARPPIASPPAEGPPAARPPAASPGRAAEALRVEDATPYHSRGRADFVLCRRWIVGLYLLSLVGILALGLPALPAMALAYLKRAGLEEPVLRSHLDRLIGGVWAYLAIALLALFFVYVGQGVVLKVAGAVGVAALLVLLWRSAKGLLRILDWRSYDGRETIPV